jgi:hypothetical protein
MPNVSAALGNDAVTLYYPNGGSYSQHQRTMQTGWYSADGGSFKAWIQAQLTALGYVADSIFVGQNSSYESLIMLSVPAGQTKTPYLVLNSSLASILGYSSTAIGVADATSTQSILSDSVPKPHVTNSLELHCNMTASNHNPLSHANILGTIPVAQVDYGGLLSRTWSELQWQDVAKNAYTALELTVTDQDGMKVSLVDLNVLIVLSFRQKKI